MFSTTFNLFIFPSRQVGTRVNNLLSYCHSPSILCNYAPGEPFLKVDMILEDSALPRSRLTVAFISVCQCQMLAARKVLPSSLVFMGVMLGSTFELLCLQTIQDNDLQHVSVF